MPKPKALPKDHRVHQLRSPDSRETCRALVSLTQSRGYPYLKQLAESIADNHGGKLPENAEDRERIYEAAIIQKGFKALWKILDALPPISESTNPSDLLDQITAEQTPPEITKEENHD